MNITIGIYEMSHNSLFALTIPGTNSQFSYVQLYNFIDHISIL